MGRPEPDVMRQGSIENKQMSPNGENQIFHISSLESRSLFYIYILHFKFDLHNKKRGAMAGLINQSFSGLTGE